MATTQDEEVKRLEKLRKRVQRRLHILKEQIAGYGQLAVAANVLLQDDALLVIADTLRSDNTDARLVLLIDQAEELWILAPTEPEAQAAFVAQQQRPFIQQLLSALRVPDSPLLILFTMRADFLHRAAELPELARAISEDVVIVSPMTADELRLAIELRSSTVDTATH